MTRSLVVGLLLALAVTGNAAPSARRCERACSWARSHCVRAFENAPRPKRCTRGVVARCGGLAACLPTTTTTSTSSTSTSSSTALPTMTTSTTTPTTTSLPGAISGHVHLALVDDCFSSHSCSTGDGEPKICNEPEPFFDATIAVTATAPDGTFAVQLDLGSDFVPLTCPGGSYEVCFDDGEHQWCGERPDVATCNGWEHVIVSGTFIEFIAGSIGADCNDVWTGTIVP